MSTLRREEILEDLYIPNSSSVNWSSLAAILGLNEESIRGALRVNSESTQLETDNLRLKKWLVVLNLIIDLIHQTELDIPKDKAHIKIRQWLNHSKIQLGSKTPLQSILEGKFRQVIILLEQLLNS